MEFIVEVDDDEKNVVDLVPSKWIVASGSSLICLYPARGGKRVYDMIKQQAESKSFWKEYPIEVLQGASKLFFNKNKFLFLIIVLFIVEKIDFYYSFRNIPFKWTVYVTIRLNDMHVTGTYTQGQRRVDRSWFESNVESTCA